MIDESKVHELLLKEYAEAGQITRQHEQLTRTSVSVFLPTLLALAGYVLSSDISNLAKVVLCIGGLAVSLLVLNIIRRHQLYYRSYIARVHAIEAFIKVEGNPVIQLYTLAKDATKGSMTISNKTAFSVFFVFSAIFFIASAAIYASHIVCRVGV